MTFSTISNTKNAPKNTQKQTFKKIKKPCQKGLHEQIINKQQLKLKNIRNAIFYLESKTLPKEYKIKKKVI